MAISKVDLTFLDLVDICDNVHLRRDNRGLYDDAFHDKILVPLYLNECPVSAAIGLPNKTIFLTPELWAHTSNREMAVSV